MPVPTGLVILALVTGIITGVGYYAPNRILFEFKEYERVIVYRYGKLHRVVGPGWKIILPIIEKFAKYDQRTESIDTRSQTIITKDGIKVLIDLVIYMRIVDPVKAELKIEKDYKHAINDVAINQLRSVIGKVKLDTVYKKTNTINEYLKLKISKIVSEWGIEISKLELKELRPPDDVLEVLKTREVIEMRKAAEKEKAETLKLRINAIQEAADNLGSSALAYLYINALKEMASGSANKIVFPLEFTRLAEDLSSKFKAS